MTLLQLALRRAGAQSLSDFQKRASLSPTGEADALTMQALEPYLTGFVRHSLRAGDTFSSLAAQYHTSARAIAVANPAAEPRRLQIGQILVVPLDFPVVPTDVPFTSELLALCVQGLTARYPFLRQRPLTRTRFGRSVTLLQLGQGSRRVLYNASHHANEWITTPVLLKFVEELSSAAAFGGEIFGRDAAALLREAELFCVPMVNPDGVDLVTGALARDSAQYDRARQIAAYFPNIPFPDGWKANLEGVDLNLNYPTGWEQARQIKYAQGFTRPAPRDFVGVSPLDQPETAAIARLTREIRPDLTLSYHTQGQVIYWKYLDLEPTGARRLGERFAALSGYALEDTPYASGFAGYKDWFLLTFDRPGYTIEVGLGQNPLPLSQFDEIYRQNLGILTTALYPDADA